jgi:hypothetical protein
MFQINLSLSENDAIDKMTRWGFKKDIDYRIISTITSDERN